MSEKSRPPHATAAFIAAASAAAIAAICTALVIAPIVPPTLDRATEPEEIPITLTTFHDPVPVTLVLKVGVASNIVAPSAGRVTTFSCTRGGKLASGSSVLAVDGAPVLTLASAIPPWRSLVWGDVGADVEAIRAELLRLGAPASTPGYLDSIDTAAYAAVLEGIGAESEGGTIELGSILWTPHDGATIASCSITPGELVSEGQTIATLEAPLNRVAVAGLPEELRGGERELLLDGVSTPIQLVEGSSVDESVLAAVASSSSYERLLLSDDEKGQISAVLVLATPLEVASIPAGSIVGIEGGLGCVMSDGASIPIEILGSELGQTYVSFIDEEAPSHIDRSPDRATTCR